MTSEPDLTRRPRTRRVFSADDMTRMAALYYDSSVPMHRAAGEFGVPASTFLRWIAEMDWPRRSARGRGAAGGAGVPAVEAPGRRLMTLDEQTQAKLNEYVDPELADFYARRRPRSLIVTLRQAYELARRELEAASQMKPETMADRERVAALIDRLARALERIGNNLSREQSNEDWRRAMRRAR